VGVRDRGAGARGSIRDVSKALPRRGAVAILVVSASAPLRKLIANVLTDEGLEVVGAASGEEALELLAPELAFSLVLVDLDTPRAAHVELVAALRDAWPDLRILATSADPELLQRASGAGADALMIKPLSENDLRLVVGLVLG
jgi:CheY-like chemotaxis protein